MRRSVLAVVALIAVTVALAGTAAPVGATLPATQQAVATAPGQQPDEPIEAPAEDGTGGSAEQQDDEPVPVPEQDIIPQPNSGHEPTEAGDRGGALQILVFVAIVAGLGTILLLARRDVLRSGARRAAGAGSDSPSEPVR